MNSTTTQNVQTAVAVAGAVAPFLGPNGVLLVGLAGSLINAAMSARDQGRDVSPADIAALVKADDMAKADGLIAEAAAIAAGDTSTLAKHEGGGKPGSEG